MAGRLRRLAPPAFLFAGLFLFGVSLLILGTEAAEDDVFPLAPSSLTVVNGTAVLVHPVEYFSAYSSDSIVTTYAFPQAPGDAYFVGCADLARMMQGHPPATPMLAFTGLREGTFAATRQTVHDPTQFHLTDEDGRRLRYCHGAIAFQWAAPPDDLMANRPTVSATYLSARLDADSFSPLAALMGGGALLALLGGLAWARARSGGPRPPPSEDSTLEALRASLDRMGEQLERTRKHLLLAGVLGVFLWYPFLVPWAWMQAKRASDDPTIPWAVAALTLGFLIVLTVLWAREFLRLDRELNAWRGRMWELRDREENLLETLDRGG